MKFILIFSIFIVYFLYLGKFLDITTKPEKSDVIVCLGGEGRDRTITALNLLQNSYSSYNKLFYVGTEKTLLNNINNAYISSISNNIIYISKMKNTMDEIIYIDNNIVNKYSKIIIVTDPPHSRRVDFMIKQFSKNLNHRYIIVSSKPKWWNDRYYFLNYKAVIFSIKEFAKIFYNYFKYTFYLPLTKTL